MAPHKIEVLTKISGVSFDEALRGSMTFDLEGHAIPYIGKAALIANKIGGTTNRPCRCRRPLAPRGALNQPWPCTKLSLIHKANAKNAEPALANSAFRFRLRGGRYPTWVTKIFVPIEVRVA